MLKGFPSNIGRCAKNNHRNCNFAAPNTKSEVARKQCSKAADMVSKEISKDCLFSVQDRLLWQARGLQCCKECTSIGVSSNWQVSYLASFALLNRCVPFPSDAFVLKVSSKDQRSQSAKFSFQKRPRFAHMKKLFVYV